MPTTPLETETDAVTRIRGLLGTVGLRTTAARLAVIRRLERSRSPVSHAEVSEELVPLGFDKATVFRNLNDLVEAGLVSRTELGDHVWRFELRDPEHDSHGPHPHFVCTGCGGVTCLHDVEIPKSIEKAWARAGRVAEILLKGVCVTCTPAPVNS